MKSPAHNREAAAVVEYLRVEAKMRDVTNSEIARKTHTTRQTVAKRFTRNDMRLSEFLAYSKAIDANPVTILSKGIAEDTTHESPQKGKA